MHSLPKTLLLILSLALSQAACGSDGGGTGDECSNGRCDDLDLPDSEVPASACDGLMHDLSGRGNSRVAGRLHDPVAEAIWQGQDGCPTSFGDIMAALREKDKEGCEGERDGIRTRVVSETAQLLDEPTSYRLVTTRRCNNREEHAVLFSLFGVQAGASSLPSNVEIIAFDSTAGVFNFYETGPGEVNFFGNSKDMLQGSQGNTRRCASCHNAGGLVMKELDTPWLHWEGHTDTPGARELVDAHPDLGTKADGANMESLVKRGNEQWNATKLTFLKEEGTMRDLLRPLFCTVEVNIDNGADFPTSTMSRIPFDSLLDRQLKGFGSISITEEDYNAQLEANGQQVPGLGAADTIFKYAFIERSHIDNDFVEQLISDGRIDEETVKDILLVDFTRPIFSDDRCELLNQVPELPTDTSAEDLKAALLEAFAGAEAGTPAGDLLANLEADGGHDAQVDKFVAACEALEGAAFVENALSVTSVMRNKARQLSVFEFQQTIPSDNLVLDDELRLDPNSCELATSYVTPAPPEAP